MEMWELIKRLLAEASGGNRTFAARPIATQYLRELAEINSGELPTRLQMQTFADEIAQKMQEIGLIRLAGIRGGGAAILGAMERTEPGEELYQALRGHNVVMLFESMQAELEVGEIHRILHQLNP